MGTFISDYFEADQFGNLRANGRFCIFIVRKFLDDSFTWSGVLAIVD